MACSPPLSDGSIQSLTADNVKRWHEDGFLIIPGALSQASVQGLRKETHDLLESFSIEE